MTLYKELPLCPSEGSLHSSESVSDSSSPPAVVQTGVPTQVVQQVQTAQQVIYEHTQCLKQTAWLKKKTHKPYVVKLSLIIAETSHCSFTVKDTVRCCPFCYLCQGRRLCDSWHFLAKYSRKWAKKQMIIFVMFWIPEGLRSNDHSQNLVPLHQQAQCFFFMEVKIIGGISWGAEVCVLQVLF